MTQYVGGGLIGEHAALVDLEARERRERDRERARRRLAKWKARADAAEPAVQAYNAGMAALFGGVMRATGHHQHSRGAWRRGKYMDINARAATILATEGELQRIVAAAQAGDAAALPDLRAVLALDDLDRPAAIKLARVLGGDAGTVAEDALLGRQCGGDLAAAEATRKTLAELRVDLAGPEATGLERLMAGVVALDWFCLNVYMKEHVRAVHATIPQDEHLEKRTDRAHRRFLRAGRTLAEVRRLALPAARGEAARRRVKLSLVS